MVWSPLASKRGDEPLHRKTCSCAKRKFAVWCCLLVGAGIEPPGLIDLKVNTNDNGVEQTLSRHLGISPNESTPGARQTRDPLEATVSHTKFYLFQEQGTVADRDTLFFRQSEQFLPQALKDTFPYFAEWSPRIDCA